MLTITLAFFSAVKIKTPFVRLLIQGFLLTLHKMTRRLTFGGRPWVHQDKKLCTVKLGDGDVGKGQPGCYLPVGKGL